MNELPLHFIRPGWLLALPLCLLLPWAWRRLRRPAGDWAQICDPHLLRWLSVGDAVATPRRAGAWLAGLAILLVTVALAGPSWQRLPDVSYNAADARVIVLDLSASMLAQDLKPDRLTQTRFMLSDLLQQTQEGEVGLVAYAGDAYVVTPLTSDRNTVANLLPALRPDVVPVAGSRADRGLALAAELLEGTGLAVGEILLVTDDADAASVNRAAELAARGLRVSVLAVGTEQGAPIPSGTGFLADAQGAVVIARVNLSQLAAVAEAGGGKLTRLDGSGLNASPWSLSDSQAFALNDNWVGDRWLDMGPWLLLLLLPLMALSFRRGLLFCWPLLMVPLLLPAPTAQAGWWDDLWKSRDQQAQEALAEGQAERALELARDPRISAEAWYRSGDYARAGQLWSQTGEAQADDHYNRGNALAVAGELEQALAAYDAALALAPEMEDAIFNRALIEQLQGQQQEQQGDNQSGESDPKDGEQQSSQQEDSEGQQESQSDEEQGESEAGESEATEGEQQGEAGEAEPGEQQLAQTWSEEDAQAMERWLRRIPDDPGGLLRRKFRNEHQRRGAPQDEKKKW